MSPLDIGAAETRGAALAAAVTPDVEAEIALLDAALLAAHAHHDPKALAARYREAARYFERAGDADQAGFLLTHAYVFALEAGLAEAEADHARLVAMGRDVPAAS